MTSFSAHSGLLPNKVLDRQLSRNLPLQATPQTITYPSPQLFDKSANIDNGAQYPFVHLKQQPFDPDFTPASQHHDCYRNRISGCFNRVNPYYRHYMPNKNKPWMFDTDFQLFSQWIDNNEPHYKIWEEKAGPFPQNKVPVEAENPYPPKLKKRRDPWTSYTNPLTQPYDSISPPSSCWDKYSHPDYRYAQTNMGYSLLSPDDKQIDCTL